MVDDKKWVEYVFVIFPGMFSVTRDVSLKHVEQKPFVLEIFLFFLPHDAYEVLRAFRLL